MNKHLAKLIKASKTYNDVVREVNRFPRWYGLAALDGGTHKALKEAYTMIKGEDCNGYRGKDSV